jgi:hypothetical protein
VECVVTLAIMAPPDSLVRRVERVSKDHLAAVDSPEQLEQQELSEALERPGKLECRVLLVCRDSVEILDHLVMLDSKDSRDRRDSKVLLEQPDLVVRQELKDNQEQLVTREQLGKLELLDKLVSLETLAVRVPRVELVSRDRQGGQANRELPDLLDQRECLLNRVLKVPLVPLVLLEQLDLPDQLVLRVVVACKVLQVLRVSLG